MAGLSMPSISEQKSALRKTVLLRRDGIKAEFRQQRGKAACERLFAEAREWQADLKESSGTKPFTLALYDSQGSEVPTERLLELALGAGWIACLPVLSASGDGGSDANETGGYDPQARATASSRSRSTWPPDDAGTDAVDSRPSQPLRTAETGSPNPASPKRIMTFVAITRENAEEAQRLFLRHPLRTVNLEQLAAAGIPAVSLQRIDAFVIPLVAFDAAGERLGYGGGYYDAVLAQIMGEPCGRDGRQPFVSGLAFAEQQVDQVPAEPHDIPLPRILVA